MRPRQVDGARRHEKMLVDQVYQPVGEAPWKIRAKVDRAILGEPPGHVDSWIFFKRRVADVWICLVVAQQNIELRLMLLDQIVFERQRLALVVHHDIFDVHNFADERSRLRVLPPRFEEVGFHAVPQRYRLAYVQDVSPASWKRYTPGSGAGSWSTFSAEFQFAARYNEREFSSPGDQVPDDTTFMIANAF